MNEGTVVQAGQAGKSRAVMPRATLSRQEVAGQLGVHPRTIYRQEQQGAFPASVGLGRKRLYRVQDVEAYIAGTWRCTGGPA